MLQPRRGIRLVLGALAILVAGTATVLAASGPPPLDGDRAPAAVPLPAQQQAPLGPSTILAADPLPTPPGTTERVSVTDGEGQADGASGGLTALIDAANGDQAISGDGRFVAFTSIAGNLTGGATPGWIYLRDRQDDTTIALPWINGDPIPSGVTAAEPSVNQDGSVVAFTVIVNTTLRGVAVVGGAATPYVLVWDRAIGTSLVSMDDAGQPAPGFQPSVSGDGQFVAYTRWAPPATPPPTPPPPPNTAPSISNLASSRSCIDNFTSSAVVSVTAVDPDGDALTLRIVLSLNTGSGTLSRFPIAMTPAGGNSWTHEIRAQDLVGYGWTGGGQIQYAVTARDARGADSQTLTDNPLLSPQTNSVYYAPSGCTIL